MRVYKKIMDVLAGVEATVLSLVTVFVTALAFINVVVRKFTSSAFGWSEELEVNLFILMIMLGCALAIREGSLISLTLIFDRLKKNGKKIFVTICTVVSTVFWVFLLKYGVDKVLSQMKSGKMTPSLGWPEWVFTIFLPIGAVFLIIHTIEYFIDAMSGTLKLEDGEEGDAE